MVLGNICVLDKTCRKHKTNEGEFAVVTRHNPATEDDVENLTLLIFAMDEKDAALSASGWLKAHPDTLLASEADVKRFAAIVDHSSTELTNLSGPMLRGIHSNYVADLLKRKTRDSVRFTEDQREEIVLASQLVGESFKATLALEDEGEQFIETHIVRIDAVEEHPERDPCTFSDIADDVHIRDQHIFREVTSYLEVDEDTDSDIGRACLALIAVVAAQDPQCAYVTLAPVVEPLNMRARSCVQVGVTGQDTNYNPFTAWGLRGQNEVVSVADTGLDDTHCFFREDSGSKMERSSLQSYIIDSRRRKVVEYVSNTDRNCDATDVEGGHGTHVAGTVCGNPSGDPFNSAGKNSGVAPEAQLAFMDLGRPGSGIYVPRHTYDLFAPTYNAGSRMQCHSWGGRFASEDPAAQYAYGDTIDDWLWRHQDMVVVFSTSNEGMRSDEPTGSLPVPTGQPTGQPTGEPTGEPSIKTRRPTLPTTRDPERYPCTFSPDGVDVGSASSRDPTPTDSSGHRFCYGQPQCRSQSTNSQRRRQGPYVERRRLGCWATRLPLPQRPFGSRRTRRSNARQDARAERAWARAQRTRPRGTIKRNGVACARAGARAAAVLASGSKPTSSAQGLLQSLSPIHALTFARCLDFFVDLSAGTFSPVPLSVSVPVPKPLGESPVHPHLHLHPHTTPFIQT